MSEFTRRLARFRVPLGFGCALAVWWLAAPTPMRLAFGGVLAISGEALRIWAAGHLNKSREVTSSGPYRFFAHPLYVGSSVMGVGLAVASGSMAVAILVAIYLGTTIVAAVMSEEAFLRGKFGDHYDRYRRGVAGAGGSAGEQARPFSLNQAIANREYRALMGLVAAALLLLLKATL